jgi:hypothetical protein
MEFTYTTNLLEQILVWIDMKPLHHSRIPRFRIVTKVADIAEYFCADREMPLK